MRILSGDFANRSTLALHLMPSSEFTPPRLPPGLGKLPLSADQRRYLRLTRTASYGFLAALPLLLLYEIGLLFINRGAATGVRISADVWLKQMLAGIGLAGHLMLGAVVFLIGIVIFWRQRGVPLVRRYFWWIMVESVLWACGLALTIGWFVSAIFGAALAPAMIAQLQVGRFEMLVLSLGAGLYEELFFRVLLVGGMAWLLVRATSLSRGKAYWIAAVAGALLFSAVHYTGPFGDPFAVGSFSYRFLFGLALNGLFLVRGFGVAAWTHALYDVLVVLLIP
ncbi:CPBP family glutamic-type intramembrane protease [soil metagenome]